MDGGFCPSLRQMIETLRLNSKYIRQRHEGKTILASSSGETFFVRRIMSVDDPVLQDVHTLIQQNFPKEEADPFTVFVARLCDERREDVAYHIVQDPDGNVLSMSDTQYIALPSRNGRESSGFLFVRYIITSEPYRDRGFAPELYQTFYQWVRERAQLLDHSFIGVIGETVNEVERFLNRMERRRIYFMECEVAHEVPYRVPPLHWNPQTGEALCKAAQVHLMLWRADGLKIFKGIELLDIIRALYARNYPSGRGVFHDDEAFDRACRTVDGYLGPLCRAISRAKDGQVFLLSQKERDEQKNSGVCFVEIKP